MRATLPTLILAMMLAAPASGFAQNKLDQQMVAELRMLQEQIQQQRLVNNAITETLKAITARQDELANQMRKAFADQKVLTDAITDRVRILAEKGDDTVVRIATLANQLEGTRQSMQALQTSVAQALAAVAAAQAAPPTGTDPATGGATVPATPAVNPAAVQSPKALYDNAYGDFAATRYELAIQGFKAFLITFPTSPNAYQAQFYIGEALYYQGRYPEAAQAYREMIDKYKDATWLPDAYYKRGRSYLEMTQKDQARADFDFVIKNFPDSTMAPLAKAARESIK